MPTLKAKFKKKTPIVLPQPTVGSKTAPKIEKPVKTQVETDYENARMGYFKELK